MALVYTEEQQMLADAAVGFFAQKSPIAAFRALRDAGGEPGYDPALWQDMIAMGFTAVLLQEHEGGTGFGYTGAGIIAEAMATTLVPSPFLSSAIVATSLLKACNDDAARKVGAGAHIATLAIDERGHHDPLATTTKATKASGGWVLSGLKIFVPDGTAANQFIVLAQAGDSAETLGLFMVEEGAKGLIVDKSVLADRRNWAKVTFEGTPATALMMGARVLPVLTAVLDKANAVLAAELLGLSEAAFQMTMAYLKDRKQFGKTIGSFQGLQHRAAHMYTEIAVTRSAVLAALHAGDADDATLSSLASIAKARAAHTAELVTNEAIQMHGGIGMTDECDVGFFIKRARSVANLYGGYNYHVDRYATLSGY